MPARQRGVSVHALTSAQHDLIIRPVAGHGELALFCRIPYLLNEELDDDLDQGRRHLDWLWMALRGGELAARAAWWTRRGSAGPLVLDIFDFDDSPAGAMAPAESAELGVRLLGVAMAQVLPPGTRPPGYGRFVPADWRDRPQSRRAIQNRMAAIERLGGQFAVERYRLNWQAGTPIPAPSGRLRFTQVSDEHELIGLMTGVLEGTLDAHSRDDLGRMSPEQVAVEQYQGELALFASPREWWQVARLPRPRLHQRDPGRRYPHPGRAGRAAHPRLDRPGQRADGPRLPPGRLGRHRPRDHHDMDLIPSCDMRLPGQCGAGRRLAGAPRTFPDAVTPGLTAGSRVMRAEVRFMLIWLWIKKRREAKRAKAAAAAQQAGAGLDGTPPAA